MSDDKRSAYMEKLRDPRWQKMRLEIMQRDHFSCQYCGDKTSTLNVHHRWYERGREPWDYPAESLVTLCESCHKVETNMRADAEADLLQALRERVFASSLIDLAVLFRGMEMPYAPDLVIPAMLRYLLAPGHVEQICQWDFEECRRRREAAT